MKHKIGIFGSAAGNLDKDIRKATELGKVFNEYADKAILLNGACSGMPSLVLSQAAKSNVEMFGYSSNLNKITQLAEYPDVDLSLYSRIIYVPANFPGAKNDRVCKKYRNVVLTSNCDAGIIISGRWGSLNEFTNLLDMQKAVGVLTGTGGIADELEELSKKISKPGRGKIIFESDPKVLVEKMLQAID